MLIEKIIILAVVVRIIERVFFHVYIWQLKEYRWDRYRNYLRSRQGIWLLLHPWYWMSVALYLWTGFMNMLERPLFVLHSWGYAMALYPIFSAVRSLMRLFRRDIRYPKPTGRATMIVLFALLTLLVPAIFSYFYDQLLFNDASPTIPTLIPILYWPLYYAPLSALVTTPLVVALLVFVSSFPTDYFKRRTIARAKTKMASLPNLKVIGITGSYGKSSTKEFLATILSAKYKVAKTPANRNSEIGVAQTVLAYNTGRCTHTSPGVDASLPEIFVVEMGAYRKGEIKAICDMVHPTVGVLTAVSEQHLALFGSLEETKKAKYELIEALPEDGIAIFNADNRATRELAEQTLKPKKLYSTERPADVAATAITVQPEKISFSLIVGDQKQHIIAPLLGTHVVSNLLAAITVAQTLGMTLPEIAEAIQQITPLDHTLKPYYHKSGALVIDDTYSANPDGVIAALNHLKLIPRKYKVLVMMPMIELGSAAKDAHRRVGERVGEVCDLAIFMQKNFFSTIRKSSKLPNEKILVLSCPQSILNALTPYLNENSVILLENRIPAAVLKSLT